MQSSPRVLGWAGAAAAGAVAAAGTAALAWRASVETRNFAVRTERLPIIPDGGRPLRILHLSDIHLLPSRHDTLEWLSTLHTLEPDLVINTGDNIASPQAVEPLLEALGPLLDVPGVFVPGSNDYFAPRVVNPLGYLTGPSAQRRDRVEMPWGALAKAFTLRGWIDLTNDTWTRVLQGVRLDFAGTDDPHLGRDEWPGFPHGTGTPARSLSIGVTHAPYRRVLDAMVADGADLILAGHTHGGQVCVPGFGALVTNCDLPPRQASGLSEWTRFERTVPLEVSAGIGTSPTAPVRFACRPEAVVLDLVPTVEPVARLSA